MTFIKKPFTEVTPRQAWELINSDDPPLVVDIRPVEYFRGDAGHIAGALNISLSVLPDRLEEIRDRAGEKPILVVCHVGKYSPRGSRILARTGFKKVYSMQKGMTEWEKQGLPVEKFSRDVFDQK
jgi:rhodanese-related sulfurtransferase